MTPPVPIGASDAPRTTLSASIDSFPPARTTALALAALALVALLPGTAARAADVFVEATKKGQGTLLRRGNECLVVTPRHVVQAEADEDGEAADPFAAVFDPGKGIVLTYADRTDTEATVFHAFEEDVALLRLDEQPTGGCRDEPFESRDLDARLRASTEAFLKRRGPDGSDTLTPVSIASFDAFDSIRVEPSLPSGSIEQGHSGSVLFADNRPVGMLVRVEKGLGIVMRGDKLMATMASFLAASRKSDSLHLSLDASSAFLAETIAREARRTGLALSDEPEAAGWRLRVTSAERRLDSDTGKIVRLAARIEIVDALDNLVTERELEASGNSFISLDAAAENARRDLATRLDESAVLGAIRR